MKVIKATILAAALAVGSLAMGGTANAVPLGSAAKAVNATDQSNVQQVRQRKYKHRHYRQHRHKRYGMHRHNRYGYYRGYRRPGFSLYIGPNYGYSNRRRYWR